MIAVYQAMVGSGRLKEACGRWFGKQLPAHVQTVCVGAAVGREGRPAFPAEDRRAERHHAQAGGPQRPAVRGAQRAGEEDRCVCVCVFSTWTLSSYCTSFLG